VPFEGEIEHRVEERMARTDEYGEGLPWRRDEVLLEDEALVALEDRLADADHAVAVADHCRDVPNLVTPRFALPDGAAEALERFQEERFDVVGLQATCLGTLHLLAHALDPAHVHRLLDEGQ